MCSSGPLVWNVRCCNLGTYGPRFRFGGKDRGDRYILTERPLVDNSMVIRSVE